MTINQIVGAVSSLVAAARESAASAQVRGYGAIREYAKALNDEFGGLSVAWFTVEHNDKGAEAEMIHSEKRAFFKVLHEKHPAGKYPNPSTVWARVRQVGQEELKAAFNTNEGEGGKGEGGEADSVGAKHTRSLALRMTEELTTLWKAGRKAEKDGIIQTREAACLVQVGNALQALGLDLASL
jgi:hypothetical protein